MSSENTEVQQNYAEEPINDGGATTSSGGGIDGANDEPCVICCEKKRSPVFVQCGHSFCKECLDKHKIHGRYSYGRRCPICRHNLAPENSFQMSEDEDDGFQDFVDTWTYMEQRFTSILQQLSVHIHMYLDMHLSRMRRQINDTDSIDTNQ